MSAGPAGPYEIMEPHKNNAVAYLTPPNPEATKEAPNSGPLPMHEPHRFVGGYDLADVEQAQAWLELIHQKIGEGFEPPSQPRGKIDSHFGADVIAKWSNIPRAAVDKKGNRQTVGTHTARAVQLAYNSMPRAGYSWEFTLFVGALIQNHDVPEGYADDTSVFEQNDIKRVTKHPREYAGNVLLQHRNHDNALLSYIHRVLNEDFGPADDRTKAMFEEALALADGYEKLEPTTQALEEKCATQIIRGDTAYDFVYKSIEKASAHDITSSAAKDICKLIMPKWNGWVEEGGRPDLKHNYENTDAFVEEVAQQVWEDKNQPEGKLYKFQSKILPKAEVVLDPSRGPQVVAAQVGNLALAREKKLRQQRSQFISPLEYRPPTLDPVA